MSMLIINLPELEVIRARKALLVGLGSALDVKRPTAWAQYGYPEAAIFFKMLQACERGGAAHGAVHRLLDGCWQQLPCIKRFDADVESVGECKTLAGLASINAWEKLRDLDRPNMVGGYAALIYRVADGKKLYEPLEKAQRLVDLIPVYESQIRLKCWNTDENSED